MGHGDRSSSLGLSFLVNPDISFNYFKQPITLPFALTYFIFILHQNPIDETFYQDNGLPVAIEWLCQCTNRQAFVPLKSVYRLPRQDSTREIYGKSNI
jgi:hypothetical protein